MVLVLAVLVVVAAGIYPSIDSMYGDYKVTGAADMVRGIWAEGQARAMDEGRPYRFALIPNANNFRIAPDSADFWSGGDINSVTTNSAEPPFVREGVLPKGVRFTDAQAQAADPSLAAGSAVPPGSQDSSGSLTVSTFLP